MPLHNLIPLCNFNYAGENPGGATLAYNSIDCIIKEETKWLSDNDLDIEVNDNKLLYQESHPLQINNSTKNLVNSINKNVNKSGLNKQLSNKIVIDIIKGESKGINTKDKIINLNMGDKIINLNKEDRIIDLKSRNQLLYITPNRNIDIERNNQRLTLNIKDICKTTLLRRLYSSLKIIGKNYNTPFINCELNDIVKTHDRGLLLCSKHLLKQENLKLLNSDIRRFNILNNKELISIDRPLIYREKYKQLNINNTELLKIINKLMLSCKDKMININSPKLLHSKLYSPISKKGVNTLEKLVLNICGDRRIKPLCRMITHFNKVSEYLLNKKDFYSIGRESIIRSLSLNQKCINIFNSINLSISSNKFISKNGSFNLVINKIKSILKLCEFNIASDSHTGNLYKPSELSLIHNKLMSMHREENYYLDRLMIYNINKENINYFYRDNQYGINKGLNVKHYYRDNIYNLNKNSNNKLFYRTILHDFYKNYQNYFNRMALISTFNNHPSKYLTYNKGVNIFKEYEKLISREVLMSIFKVENNYLDYSALLDVYKESSKNLGRLSLLDIFNIEIKYIKDLGIKDIHVTNYQSIEVIKRWWWLNESNPKDRLIIPNNDYKHIVDLLSNTNFEYLRYNNHPIEWGDDWGKDWSIPPYAVSIEIMLDLVNILIMIWHKNTQGWLCCTGKEGIQFIMELLYDWYSMNTSNPNESYKRAYRWIRWEAEKVYFKQTSSGLQSIGMLIGNLIDYLRIHHFNVVPIWRKPISMDQGRYFNKLAENGDLMKKLDKNKGSRHYPIETQNYEKKDIFRR